MADEPRAMPLDLPPMVERVVSTPSRECASGGAGGVLVIEDDADARDVMLAIFEACGYPVVGAANGYDGLRILRAGQRPGLIVLDLMMPVMDGWQFRTAQLQEDDLAAIPTLVCSACSDAEPRALSMGAIAYLRKPIDFDRLLDIVEAHCTAR